MKQQTADNLKIFIAPVNGLYKLRAADGTKICCWLKKGRAIDLNSYKTRKNNNESSKTNNCET